MKTTHLKILTAVGVVLIVGLLVQRFNAHSSKPTTTTTAAVTTTTTTQPSGPTTTGTGNGTVTARSYRVGDCVMWNQSVPLAEPRVVPCSNLHIFEVTGKAEMPSGKFPQPDQWSALDSVAGGQCYDIAVTYLGNHLYPNNGRFTVASLDPVRSAWISGQNWAW